MNLNYHLLQLAVAITTNIILDGTFTTLPIPIGTYGNFSFIQAPPKSMKSFFSSLLVSAYQSGGNKLTGRIKGHRDNKKIIHFDTEQSKFHCQKLFRRPIIMNDLEKDENYYTYALRPMDATRQRIDFIEYILYTKFAGDKIGLVIIDGVADLTSDVNSMEQSTEVQELLMRWTDDLQCHISTIIHSNYGTTKPTGVLGSALEKKAETQIMLEKNNVNKGWVTVECKRGRNREFDTFSFGFEENGLPKFIKDDFEF
jgi:hypothetical protein